MPAPAAGTLAEILAAEGTNVPVGAVLGIIADGAAAGGPSPQPRSPASLPRAGEHGDAASRLAPQRGRGRRAGAMRGSSNAPGRRCASWSRRAGSTRRAIAPTGPGGRLTKADVIAAREAPAPAPRAARHRQRRHSRPTRVRAVRRMRETRVRMTRLRRRIAERLKEAQNTAAMLTTFNEIDMSAAMALRERWREAFEKKHGVRLGFMSIFVKAAIVALKELPAVNAEIDGDDIVYKNHYDIGVAVGTEQGLVVPVVRDADRMSFAEIEKEIAELGRKARDGKLTIEELSGGTFTISNGGVYGSLLSTPILNPPQSGDPRHAQDRAAARSRCGERKIEIRPMMYVALTYDHRIIDGREAVTFLVRIKECVEDPLAQLLFDNS